MNEGVEGDFEAAYAGHSKMWEKIDRLERDIAGYHVMVVVLAILLVMTWGGLIAKTYGWFGFTPCP